MPANRIRPAVIDAHLCNEFWDLVVDRLLHQRRNARVLNYPEAMRTLLIDEDSGNHLDNFTWAFNVDSKQAVRIVSAPPGGENTGLKVYDNINGHAYVTGNVQHPRAAEDLHKYPAEIKVELRRLVDERGIVGHFGDLPATTR